MKWPPPKDKSSPFLGDCWIPDDTRTSLLLQTLRNNSSHMNLWFPMITVGCCLKTPTYVQFRSRILLGTLTSSAVKVVGVRHLVTSPALLESTSLVFAYGQDLFFTKVAPSGRFDLLSESFNKIQLVLIIAGLSLAISVTRPIVQRRQLKQHWYSL